MKKIISIFTVLILTFTVISAFPVSAEDSDGYEIVDNVLINSSTKEPVLSKDLANSVSKPSAKRLLSYLDPIDSNGGSVFPNDDPYFSYGDTFSIEAYINSLSYIYVYDNTGSELAKKSRKILKDSGFLFENSNTAKYPLIYYQDVSHDSYSHAFYYKIEDSELDWFLPLYSLSASDHFTSPDKYTNRFYMLTLTFQYTDVKNIKISDNYHGNRILFSNYTFFSRSKFELVEYGGAFTLKSSDNSPISYFSSSVNEFVSDSSESLFYTPITCSYLGKLTSSTDPFFYNNFEDFKGFNNSYDDFKMRSVYCNFDLNTDVFKNNKFDIGGNISDYCTDIDSSLLKDEIDFKLTPEFCIDMDRVFDKSTGQNDYFKFEITNNSIKNLQWSLSIVTVKQYETYISDDSGLIYKPDTEPPWAYLLNETYYNETEEHEKKLLFKETHIFPELYTGLFQYHLLKSGDSYSDVVAWENVNIKANEEYVIVLSGFFY